MAAPGAEIIAFGLRFGLDTICCVTREIESDRPCHAAIVTRAFFELAARVRWAGLTNDGWNRLLAYWACEYKETANEALESDGFAEHRQALQDVVAFCEPDDLKDVKPCPRGMREVLRQIEQALAGDSCASGRRSGGVEYIGYRDMCRAVHANFSLCGGGIPTSELGHVVLANNLYATFWLTEAWGRFLNRDVEEEVASLRRLLDACGSQAWS